MGPERLREIEELYHLARERPAEEQAVLLAQADPELRREVESLLAQQGEDGPLDRPALEVAAGLLNDATQTRLTVGEQLGPYKIEAALGIGGMGQVYKARDTRLGRAVAIKISNKQFSERFEREARAISALNHPHICTLYDVGPNYLVMELVEGQTLADRLKQGALPMESVLRYGAQIADALASAHSHRTVHRDLKPGNIMIAKSGVKVLDFGLAKSPQDETLTGSQVVMGSPAYMAPEQREGKACDARTDIYALGLVLYEMATGKRPPSDEPATLGALPEGLAHVIDRCLDKDCEQRWQSAQDLAAQLLWLAKTRTLPSAPAITGHTNRIWFVAGAILVAAVFAFAYFARKAHSPDPLARFSFAPPFSAKALDVAVSPDGRRIAFANSHGGSMLWLRSVDSFDAEPLPGTSGATRPFWSPDGHSIGFFSGGLKRVEASSQQTPVRTIIASLNETLGGGSWSRDGVLLYQSELAGSGLYQIRLRDGASMAATKLNSERHDIVHRFPQFLPDGRHFIYWVWSTAEENTGIYIGSLDPREKVPEGPLVRTWREAQYAEPGYLLFLQGTRLVAQRFDAGRLRLSGEPFSLAEHVGMNWSNTGRAGFSVSSGAIMAFQEAMPLPTGKIVWRDRSGKELRSLDIPRRSGSMFSLAPDEKHIVLCLEDENTLEDLWVVDLDRATSLRLTASHGSNQFPVWSPDGRRIAFRSNRNGVYDIYTKDASGMGEEELLVKSRYTKIRFSWSPDGRFLIYDEFDPKTGADLWALPLQGERKPFPILKTDFNEDWATISPVADGQGHMWMAYQSDETGRDEIYIRSFQPGAPSGPMGTRIPVSTAGGRFPRWRKDGRELFYVAGSKLMAVGVKLGAAPEINTAQFLFDLRPDTYLQWVSLGDGHRFLLVEPAGQSTTPKINIVLNWTAQLNGN